MTSNKKDDSFKYDGSQGTWERFDKHVLRRMRKKLCDLGEGFWCGALPDLGALDENGYDEHIRTK